MEKTEELQTQIDDLICDVENIPYSEDKRSASDVAYDVKMFIYEVLRLKGGKV